MTRGEDTKIMYSAEISIVCSTWSFNVKLWGDNLGENERRGDQDEKRQL